MMNTRLTILRAAACALAAAAAQGALLDTTVEAEVEMTSAWVWRGQVVNAHPCLQPSLLYAAGNFNLDVWSSLDLEAEAETWERNRVDIKGRYAWEHGVHIVTAGLAAYVYHDGPRGRTKDTWETILGYTADVPLLPSVLVYYDIDRINGAYATASLTHSLELLPDRAALDLGVYLGAGEPNYLNGAFDFRGGRERVEQGPAYRKAAFVDLVGAVWMPLHLRREVVLTPGVEYMTIVDRGLRAAVVNSDDEADKLFYSLSVSALF